MDNATLNHDHSSSIALLRKLRVDQVARWLDIHPFEVIRTLVHAEALPADLRLDAQDVERVRVSGGIESLWEGVVVPESDAALLGQLLHMLCDRLAQPGASPARCDNLFRGLERNRRHFLRRAVNEIVRMGYLELVMTTRGLSVKLTAGGPPALARLALDTLQVAAIVGGLQNAEGDE